ncbi:MAG: cyclase family protein [Gammaproteobacteria bacterium]|nr:cyclase family protein [Gammaproteobacteria bacterium]
MTVLHELANAIAGGDIETVDLTHTLDPDFPVIVLPPEFGQCARFRVEEISAYDERGPGWYWRNFSCGEHTGTHFDAPVHWISGKDLPNGSVDSIPPDAFVRPVCVVDCSAESAADEDFLLTPEFLVAWEKRHGLIPANSWVLMRTDWSKRSGAAYLNMREDGAHTPGPSGDAVKFLIDERNVVGFGTETVGTDAGQAVHLSPPHPAHYLFHGAGKYGLQCLRNLDRLPPTGAILVCPPLKIKNGSGSPLRVLALVDRSKG